MHCNKYNPYETSSFYLVFKQGSKSDCFFIIFKGTVGVFVASEKIGHCDEGGHFGELGLDKQSVRMADVIAETSVIAFQIPGDDYNRIVYNYKNLEKHLNFKIFKEIPFFSNMSYHKIQNIISNCAGSVYSPGDVVYECGSKSYGFYIVTSGAVELQFYLELKTRNKWPVGSSQ